MIRFLLAVIKLLIIMVSSFVIFILQFILNLSTSILFYIFSLMIIISLILFLSHETKQGFLALLFAFSISPFGIPAIAQFIIDILGGLLNRFIYGKQQQEPYEDE